MLTAFIFIINVALSRPLIEALLFSLAIAVGIAPEMMPAIVTVSLSAGSKALAAKKVLVKRLVAIEDLGNIEILFTDKTGTLTEGVITFEHGTRCRRARRATAHCCSGWSATKRRSPQDGPVGGNALDQALWSAPGPRTGEGGRRDRGRLCSGWASFPSTTNDSWPRCWSRTLAGKPLLITKGAPEVVLDRCVNVPDGARSALEALFSEGARVVAVATRPAEGLAALTAEDEQGLTLVGLPDLRRSTQGRCRFLHRPARAAGGRGQDHHRRQRPGGSQGVLGHRGRLRRGAQR